MLLWSYLRGVGRFSSILVWFAGKEKGGLSRLFPSILPEANRPGILRPVPDDIPNYSSSPPPITTGVLAASMVPFPFM